jgi:hypothetical protein
VLFDVLDERVETEFQVRYQGRFGLPAGAPGTAGADEATDDGGVFGNDGHVPAIDLDAVVYQVVGITGQSVPDLVWWRGGSCKGRPDSFCTIETGAASVIW